MCKRWYVGRKKEGWSRLAEGLVLWGAGRVSMAVGCYWDLESDDGLTIVNGKLCVCSGVMLPVFPSVRGLN